MFRATVERQVVVGYAKLDGHAAEAKAEEWACVDVAHAATYADLQAFQRAPRERRNPTKREADRMEMQAIGEALDAALDDEDEEDAEALQEEGHRVGEQLQAGAGRSFAGSRPERQSRRRCHCHAGPARPNCRASRPETGGYAPACCRGMSPPATSILIGGFRPRRTACRSIEGRTSRPAAPRCGRGAAGFKQNRPQVELRLGADAQNPGAAFAAPGANPKGASAGRSHLAGPGYHVQTLESQSAAAPSPTGWRGDGLCVVFPRPA